MSDLEIAFRLNDQILTFWQFYVAWSAGVIGWVFSRSRPWSLQKCLGVAAGVMIFNVFNLVGLYKTVSSLSLILTAMRDQAYQVPAGLTDAVFYATLQRLEVGHWYMNIGPHLVADAIVLFFILVVARRVPRAPT
ncbi:hypothetical protein [Thiomicrorhabdus sp. 6S3-12]|uniref:hypothetical protein n=1 Tax=Thiomicrorhabdus sp. 6S3-12 TaxID=2819681 RepID=UPI001AAC735A|nr:hypothetical protein [Thiomicrorhabdus sp. 6S3-12]MBO1924418.1 hypothetical protein [Thiomicrorhabdus sp. 6S3-12]